MAPVASSIVLDPKTRRINEILFHKCEFTDEMCDLRRQSVILPQVTFGIAVRMAVMSIVAGNEA